MFVNRIRTLVILCINHNLFLLFLLLFNFITLKINVLSIYV